MFLAILFIKLNIKKLANLFPVKFFFFTKLTLEQNQILLVNVGMTLSVVAEISFSSTGTQWSGSAFDRLSNTDPEEEKFF
jgi:hypothetical protein